ncbi:hypothetical protein D9615_008095 [Tricholomella constricta]|uniref:Response regulatory domain-containing protein n=1 Tax=Tricholomella constricta TaxID=117010 RepID=A0A8H5GVM5_9AGAR|nr:hypothetical protein D9615_008095 [Tricholomella constricta]
MMLMTGTVDGVMKGTGLLMTTVVAAGVGVLLQMKLVESDVALCRHMTGTDMILVPGTVTTMSIVLDAHSRGGYGYSPPRRGHPAAFAPSRRAPADPHTFDYPASLKQYAEWFRWFYPQQAIEEDNADKAAEQDAGDGSKPRNGIKSKWEKYKKDFAATQLQIMFDHHRRSPWFAEKYDPAPELQNLRMRVRKEGWKGRLDAFLVDLDSGKYDPDLHESELESPSPIKEHAVNGESATTEANGATGEEAKSGGADDDMQFNVDADDEPGDNEPSRADTNGRGAFDKRSNRGEEVSVAPEGNQVMIRTIPPDIGRAKLEEACGKIPGFIYLALGDPLQKRNYYRAGWLRFRDDADMPAVLSELSDKKIEGFKLHVTHNQRPFVNRIRYAPEVASKPDRIQKDLLTIRTLATVLEEQAAKLRQYKPTPVPPIGRDQTVSADGPEDTTMAPPPVDEMEEEPEPKENGSEAVERRIEKVMSDMRNLGLVDVNDEKAYEEKKVKARHFCLSLDWSADAPFWFLCVQTVVSLDLYIAYLRAAFNTCYYCSVVTDHLEELQRKCLKHARKPLSKAMLEEVKAAEAEKEKKEEKGMDETDGTNEIEKEKEKDVKKDRQGDRNWKQNDDRWLDWLDSKLALLINRDGVDPRAYSGKGYDEELTKAVEAFIKQEDEGKFRCKTCQKLFKATSFVEKHIANKHPEHVKHLEDIPYFNNFALDPHHIQPFTHPPPIVGNTSQAPPPQAYGIQMPPAYHGGDYSRPGPFYSGGGGYPPSFPPPYQNSYWDHHPLNGPPAPYGPPGGYPPPFLSRRDDPISARRLSDRISGYAPGTESSTIPAGAGLPPKPTAAALDSALVSGNGGGERGGGGRRGRNSGVQGGGPPPPPPPDAKEDPRAAAGKRISYHDMDLVAEAIIALILESLFSTIVHLLFLDEDTVVASPVVMTTPKLPAVRLPVVNGGECVTPDGVVLELPPSKFSVSWPSETRTTASTPASERVNLSFTEGDSEMSDGDSGNEQKDLAEQGDESTGANTPVQARTSTAARSPGPPHLSRALSMPLPSQLGYLKHPHRSDIASSPEESLSYPPTPDSSRLKELSVELADSVQMIIQTMLQISPPQLLDPAKEQFSACSLSVPTSSMSAMLTSMKNLNYISANMSCLCSEVEDVECMDISRVDTPTLQTDFDIGEMLQSVGDSLSGAAAQAGVDLVLYHGDDIGLRHVVRQVLATAQPGDTIELGLLVGSIDPRTGTQMPTDEDASPTEPDDPLSCTIRISHKYGTAPAPFTDGEPPAHARPRPALSTLLLRRILRQIGATLTPDLPPPKLFLDGRTCDFTLSLDRGSLPVLNSQIYNQSTDDDPTAGEPSVEQLTLFAEGLKGKRVTLYANAKGSFAQHLSSYLTAWGMDLTHVSPNGEVDGLPHTPPSPTSLMPPPPGLPPTYDAKADSPPRASFKDHPSFIFIDDDIEVLKERLHALRADKPYQLTLNLRKRPSLVANHRPRSSPQVARTMGLSQVSTAPTPVVIVHFTSLTNYKMIKDVIQSVMASHAGSAAPLPEIMIIPKPAGPRRFLTALHTAMTKPVVDPFFSPIATSPGSPSIHPVGSFFHSYHNPEANSPRSSAKTNRPSGSRSNSDRSTKSAKDLMDLSAHCAPPSPLTIPDNVEYFSEAAAKLGASPSSGLVIQSPDGQPAGIFFHPRGKSPRNPSAQSMERDKGHLQPPEPKRRLSRLSVNTEPTNPISFSSLHAVVASTSSNPVIEAWTAASPSARAAARKSSPSNEDSLSPSASSSTLPRRSLAVETPRKSTPPGSPPIENGPPPRRGTPRRMTQEVTAPSPSAAFAAASKKVKAAADGNIVPPISVLIVDDNPINQTILSTFMKKKKIKYDLANNGQEAVQKWRTGGFHLILMPVMDGIQATKEIRRLEQLNAVAGYPPGTPSFEEHRSPLRTPSDTSSDPKSASSPYRSSVIIVALTASSLQSDRVAALAAGCNDFLTKPVSLLWLNSKIIEWGSIKALQMWADLRPDAINMATEQAVQARSVADRLHVPQGRTTPSPSRKVTSLNVRTPQPVSGASGLVLSGLPSSAPSSVGGGVSTSYWGHYGASASAAPAKTPSESAKDLARGGRRVTIPIPSSLASVAASIHASDVSSSPPKPVASGADDNQEERTGSSTRSNSNSSINYVIILHLWMRAGLPFLPSVMEPEGRTEEKLTGPPSKRMPDPLAISSSPLTVDHHALDQEVLANIRDVPSILYDSGDPDAAYKFLWRQTINLTPGLKHEFALPSHPFYEENKDQLANLIAEAWRAKSFQRIRELGSFIRL